MGDIIGTWTSMVEAHKLSKEMVKEIAHQIATEGEILKALELTSSKLADVVQTKTKKMKTPHTPNPPKERGMVWEGTNRGIQFTDQCGPITKAPPLWNTIAEKSGYKKPKKKMGEYKLEAKNVLDIKGIPGSFIEAEHIQATFAPKYQLHFLGIPIVVTDGIPPTAAIAMNSSGTMAEPAHQTPELTLETLAKTIDTFKENNPHHFGAPDKLLMGPEMYLKMQEVMNANKGKGIPMISWGTAPQLKNEGLLPQVLKAIPDPLLEQMMSMGLNLYDVTQVNVTDDINFKTKSYDVQFKDGTHYCMTLDKYQLWDKL